MVAHLRRGCPLCVSSAAALISIIGGQVVAVDDDEAVVLDLVEFGVTDHEFAVQRPVDEPTDQVSEALATVVGGHWDAADSGNVTPDVLQQEPGYRMSQLVRAAR